MPMDENYLKHYGTLGMRWGHRKSSSSIQKSAKIVSNGRRAVKNVFGSIAGRITMDLAGMSYISNKTKVDNFILQKIGIHMP